MRVAREPVRLVRHPALEQRRHDVDPPEADVLARLALWLADVAAEDASAARAQARSAAALPQTADRATG